MFSGPQYRACKKCGRRFSFPNDWCKHLNDPIEYPRSEEAKRRIAESHKNPWNKGKGPATEEERLQRSRRYGAKWRAKHPDKVKENGRKWGRTSKFLEYHSQWQRKNRTKLNKRSRQRRKQNHTLALERDRKWRDTHRQNIRETFIRSRHGISLAQVGQIKLTQENKCGICKHVFDNSSEHGPHVDHSHETMRIRGLLCHGCNAALGLFRDDPYLLQMAIGYLSSGTTFDIDVATAESALKKYQTVAKLKVRQLLLAKQEGRCAICQRIFDGRVPHVDHDHVTNRIRGLLCMGCNQGLGLLKDDVAIIEAAIRYLEVGGVPQIIPILVPNA